MKNVSYGRGALLCLSMLFSSIFCAEISARMPEETSRIIEKHVQFLARIGCLKTHKIHFSGIHFSNALLLECLKEIEKEQSFEPLLVAWHKIQKLPEADAVLIGQYALVLLLSYHVSLGCYTQPNRLAWLSLISLYTQLNMIPLKKLFDALDECYRQYMAIIENLPGDKDESWYEWLQNYWWAPATIGVFTLYSFIRWQQTRPIKQIH